MEQAEKPKTAIIDISITEVMSGDVRSIAMLLNWMNSVQIIRDRYNLKITFVSSDRSYNWKSLQEYNKSLLLRAGRGYKNLQWDIATDHYKRVEEDYIIEYAQDMIYEKLEKIDGLLLPGNQTQNLLIACIEAYSAGKDRSICHDYIMSVMCNLLGIVPNTDFKPGLEDKNRKSIYIWMKNTHELDVLGMPGHWLSKRFCYALAVRLLQNDTNCEVIFCGDRPDNTVGNSFRSFVKERVNAKQQEGCLSRFFYNFYNPKISITDQIMILYQHTLFIQRGTRNVVHIGGRSGQLELFMLTGCKVVYIEEVGCTRGHKRITDTYGRFEFDKKLVGEVPMVNCIQILPTTRRGIKLARTIDNINEVMHGIYKRTPEEQRIGAGWKQMKKDKRDAPDVYRLIAEKSCSIIKNLYGKRNEINGTFAESFRNTQGGVILESNKKMPTRLSDVVPRDNQEMEKTVILLDVERVVEVALATAKDEDYIEAMTLPSVEDYRTKGDGVLNYKVENKKNNEDLTKTAKQLEEERARQMVIEAKKREEEDDSNDFFTNLY
jgi:hypothetical protein